MYFGIHNDDQKGISLVKETGKEAIVMSTNNIHFLDRIIKKVPKINLNICFLEQLEEFPRDSETSSNQPR